MPKVDVVLYAPIQMTQDELMAVATGELNLATLIERQASTNLEISGEAYVCDTDSIAYDVTCDLPAINLVKKDA